MLSFLKTLGLVLFCCFAGVGCVLAFIFMMRGFGELMWWLFETTGAVGATSIFLGTLIGICVYIFFVRQS